MRTLPKLLAFVGLACACNLASAQFRYYEFGKIETIDAYGLFVAHGQITATETHTPTWVQTPWRADITITEIDSPAGDTLAISHRVGHRQAPHAGEPAFGPWFRQGGSLTPTRPVPYILNYGGGLHGDHLDDHFAITYADLQSDYPSIRSYLHLAGGLHFGDGSSIWDIIRRFAIAGGVLAVPPTNSEAKALCAVVTGKGGEAVVAIVADGIRPEDIFAADIRLGAPGTIGIPVLDLGSADAWIGFEHGMARFIPLKNFPADLVPALRLGLLSVNLATWNYPSGEIRGQLIAMRKTSGLPWP